MNEMVERLGVTETVYITDEMFRRAPKTADYQQENLALQDLARQMLDHPEAVLPRLVDLAIELCDGIAGGISLYEENPAPGVFRWRYLRGTLARFDGATTPRNFSPCGITLDQRRAVLVQRPERVYTWLVEADVSLAECLLVPLFVGGEEPLGTLWIVSEHEGHFDSVHARLATELATFAGIAVHMVRAGQRLAGALEQQEILTREMSHRIKNMFSITGGLIRASAKTAPTPDELAKTLSGRVDALAAANALVHSDFGEEAAVYRADLRDVVHKILLPHERLSGDSRFVIEGADVSLGDHATNGVALVLHELVTNAAKYGALKYDAGSVTVAWRENAGRLVLEWTEQGGPAIDGPPRETGFGTRLSQRTVVGQFGGELTYDWRPEGLRVVISLPIAKLTR